MRSKTIILSYSDACSLNEDGFIDRSSCQRTQGAGATNMFTSPHINLVLVG